jgi:hypothetical protein
MIAGTNYLLSVAKIFTAGDWNYRRRVLVVPSLVAVLILAKLIHWLSTPPG